MGDSRCGKVVFERYIFTSIVRVKCDDVMLKVVFYNCLKSNKSFLNIRLTFQRIEPDVFTVVVNKNYVVFKPIIRNNRRCPYIREYEFKRMRRTNSRSRKGCL